MNLLPAAINPSSDAESKQFLKQLMAKYGVKEKQVWKNNNQTQKQRAYVVDVKDLEEKNEIIAAIWKFNVAHPEKRALTAVSVAGWAAKDPGALALLSEKARKEKLVEEYGQSYSLSPITGVGADVIMRIAPEAQKILFFINEKKEVSIQIASSCRITDVEQELAKRKLALQPHMSTLHVCSFGGLGATGGYGPGKDYQSMTTDIAQMDVVNPMGESLFLSKTKNPKLFSILQHCHLGAAFSINTMVMENIRRDFLMKRTDLLLKDVKAFKAAMAFKDLLNKEHFIMHYFPVGMHHKREDHFPRFRVSTFEETIEAPTESTKTLPQGKEDTTDWENLELTALGEPLIKGVVNSTRLQKYFDVVLELSARKTFGDKPEKVTIGPSADVMHLLKTYTEAPLVDINWLIQVRDVNAGQALLCDLMTFAEERLTSYAKDDKYPVLTIYARFLKGIYDPPGEGGITPTAVDTDGHYILSFELVTYSPLKKTAAFQELQGEIIKLLQANQFKFKYHPGKTWPDNITSLTQIYTDAIDKQRLANFQNAVIDMHGGPDNIKHSPFLTKEKLHLIGLSSEEPPKVKPKKVEKIPTAHREATLAKIIEVAKELNHPSLNSAVEMANSKKPA